MNRGIILEWTLEKRDREDNAILIFTYKKQKVLKERVYIRTKSKLLMAIHT